MAQSHRRSGTGRSPVPDRPGSPDQPTFTVAVAVFLSSPVPVTGMVCLTFEPFFAICALKFHARERDGSEAARRAQVDEAYRLFTNGQEGPITLAHLKRVAAVLREDVDDEVLKDMILEANGGAGVARGVRMDEFDEVMRSAGVWR